MKNAVILHGLGNTSQGNWFPWLKTKLEERGWKVWVPDLPNTDKPNGKTNATYVLDNWEFDNESILIGHSAGTVAAQVILQNLPVDITIDSCILVSALQNDLGWEDLSELFTEPLDFQKIKLKAKKFILLHSDNDPYVPLEQAEYLANKLGGQLIIKKGQGHFNLNVNPPYKEFPFLLELLKK